MYVCLLPVLTHSKASFSVSRSCPGTRAKGDYVLALIGPTQMSCYKAFTWLLALR